MYIYLLVFRTCFQFYLIKYFCPLLILSFGHSHAFSLTLSLSFSSFFSFSIYTIRTLCFSHICGWFLSSFRSFFIGDVYSDFSVIWFCAYSLFSFWSLSMLFPYLILTSVVLKSANSMLTNRIVSLNWTIINNCHDLI